MIYEKLAKIQEELFVPKDQKNNFGNYNYRSCEDILKTVKPLCKKYKCLLWLDSSVVPIGDKNYVRATAILCDLEEDSTVSSKAYAREEDVKKGMDSSQISGSCLSYARKYALAGLFCIDNEKDSDATNTEVKTATEGQLGILKKRYQGENLTKLLKANKINKLEDLPMETASNIISKLTEGK